MSALKFQFLFSFSNCRRLAAFCLAGSLLLSISVSRAQQPGADSAGVYTGLPKNSVIATVPVGFSALGVAVSPDNKTVYVGNPAAGSVSVIDASTYSAKSTFKVGYNSFNLVLSPDGKILYVATLTGVFLIDTTQSTYPTITILNAGSTPYGLALSPNGEKLYICNYGNVSQHDPGTVVAFDTSNYASTTFRTNGQPHEALFTNNGNQVDVLNLGGDGFLQFIDTLSGKVSRSTGAGGDIFIPSGMTSDLAATTLYITDYENYVSVCKASDGTAIKKILAVPDQLSSVGLGQPALTHDGKYLYVPYSVDNNGQTDLNQVGMIDVETGKIVGTPITVGNYPFWAQISPDGKTLYVSNYHDGTLSVIDITPQ